jgi:ribosomal protein S13
MARISGVTIPNEKQIWVALTYVYGIGPKSAQDILTAAKVESTVRVKDLTDAEVASVQEVINSKYSKISIHTVASGTKLICQAVASAPRPTPAPVVDVN